MSNLRARLADAFLAPPAVEAREPRRRHALPPMTPPAPTPPPGAPSVAILCRPEDALAVGGAAALLLAARSQAAKGLVATWGAGPPVRAPARGAARRLAATLAARGHDASATGRLTIVRLGGELRAAAAEAVRARAAAGDAPSVVVIAGARDEAGDDLLRDQGEVVVALPAGGDPAVAELTLAGLRDLGIHGTRIDLPALTPPARMLAASGVAVAPALRAAVGPALDAVAPSGR